MFRDEILDVQSLKCSFVHRSWSWNRIYLDKDATSIIGSFGVVGLHVRAGEFFVFILFCSWLFWPVSPISCLCLAFC